MARRVAVIGLDCAEPRLVFDAFADETGRQAHLNGPIAKALMAHASELLSKPPSIEPVEILGAKVP